MKDQVTLTGFHGVVHEGAQVPTRVSPDLRRTEQGVSAYFSMSSYDRSMTVGTVYIEPDSPILAALRESGEELCEARGLIAGREVVTVDLSEGEGLDIRLTEWVSACAQSDPKIAFQSMYKVLSRIEKAPDGEGVLGVGQHSAILKAAIQSVKASEMEPGKKFIALAGITRFVGGAQSGILSKDIHPAMNAEIEKTDPAEFCELLSMAFLSTEWELPDEEQEQEDVVIVDDVVVVIDSEPDVFSDVAQARLGGRQRSKVQEILAAQALSTPHKMLPIMEAEGQEGIKNILYSIEDKGGLGGRDVGAVARVVALEQQKALGYDADSAPDPV